MFCHHHEVQLVRARCGNNVFECAGAMSSQKGMNVDDPFVLDEVAVSVINALRIELFDGCVQTTKFVATIGEGKLREENKDRQDQDSLFPAFHGFGSELCTLILVLWSWYFALVSLLEARSSKSERSKYEAQST